MLVDFHPAPRPLRGKCEGRRPRKERLWLAIVAVTWWQQEKWRWRHNEVKLYQGLKLTSMTSLVTEVIQALSIVRKFRSERDWRPWSGQYARAVLVINNQHHAQRCRARKLFNMRLYGTLCFNYFRWHRRMFSYGSDGVFNLLLGELYPRENEIIPDVRKRRMTGFWSFCMTPTYVMLNPQCDVTGNTRMVA